MFGTVLTQMRSTWKRTLAILIAVVIGVAFVTFSFLAGDLVNAQLGKEVGNQVRGADIIVTSNDSLTLEDVDRVASMSSVAGAEPMLVSGGEIDLGARRSYLSLGQLPEQQALRDGIQVEDGRLPDVPGEIAIAQSVRDMNAVQIGDVVSWTEYDPDGGEGVDFRVVGIFAGGPGIALNTYDGVVLPQDFANAARDSIMPAVLVTIDSGSDADAVRAVLSDALGETYIVETFQQFVDRAVDYYTGGSLTVQVVIGVFALIAMFAAGIVISNTFQITITQRIRELAIMRCIGATGSHIRRLVLIESALLGVIAAIVGTATGFGLAILTDAVLIGGDDLAPAVSVDPAAIIAPIIVGVIVTVSAAMKPAAMATHVHPLQAIRTLDAPAEDEGVGRLRKVGSIGMLLLGGGLLAWGVLLSQSTSADLSLPLLIGILGGMVSFLGLLVGARLVVPAAVALVGRLARVVSGVPGEIATVNLQRNPGRTSSTSAALLMGVTLVTMCLVGVATVKDTFVEYFDERAAIDLDLRVRQGGDSVSSVTALGDRVADVSGVESVATINVASLTAISPDGSSLELPVVGIDPSAGRSVSRAEGLNQLSGDVMILGEFEAMIYGVEEGRRITLQGANGDHEVTVVVANVLSDEGIVSEDTLRQMVGDEGQRGIWIRLENGAAVGDVTERIESVVPADVAFDVGGSAQDRERNLDAMDQVLLVAIGLLGAAVIIAVVGVGNTLTLSVLERSRESGMLRAMGLTASQMRTSLAVEGILLAVAGALIGAVAGTLYGWAGAMTLFGNSFPVEPGFPMGQLLMVGVIAIAAGLLASVIPARKALQVSPVEALASAE
jgi:putative ABC transport system permease protein